MSYNSKYKSSKIEEILDSVGGKQDKITDLEAIRSGAEKGATALQSIPSEYVTETELTAKGYATTSALNNKVDKVSGKQLSTEDFTTALKTKLEGLSNYDDTEIENAISSLQTQFNTLVSGDASDAINSFNEIMAFLDGIKDTQDLAGIIASIEQQIAAKQDKITDLDTIRSGAAKGATALQSEQYKGTITGVSANGTSVATSGVANIPAASTSAYGVTKLSSATNSTSTSLAATASAVKAAYDLANGKQDKLTSGTNIKTINGTSILGSGNITISGGSSDANIQAVDTGDVLEDVTVNYATTAYVDGLVGDINSVLESIINGGGSGISLITFTINATEYQAEEGMTWEDWVNSEYSADAFFIAGNMIRFKENSALIAAQGAAEFSTNPIIAGYVYHLKPMDNN